MKELAKQYKGAKKRAMYLMQLGDITAYLEALGEMNQYKRMMTQMVWN